MFGGLELAELTPEVTVELPVLDDDEGAAVAGAVADGVEVRLPAGDGELVANAIVEL